jgi:hypothetical protein
VAPTRGASGTSTMGTMIGTTGGMNQPPFAVSRQRWLSHAAMSPGLGIRP